MIEKTTMKFVVFILQLPIRMNILLVRNIVIPFTVLQLSFIFRIFNCKLFLCLPFATPNDVSVLGDLGRGGGIRINPLGVCPFGYAKGISLSLMHFYHLGKMHWFPGTPGHGE